MAGEFAGQRLYNWFGVIAFYFLTLVVVTSYFRPQLRSRVWKTLHYSAYIAAAFLFVHGTLIDQNLKKQAPDFLDGEKVLVEGCGLLVAGASMWRLCYAMRKPSKRLARVKVEV